MKVTLLHNTPLWINAHGARTCWDSGDKSDTKEYQLQAIEEAILEDNYGFTCDHIIGPNDAALIERVGNKFKHQSILEHVSYNFFIEGISRALLQELARHRMASYSIKSTRYTLKELKEESSFITDYVDGVPSVNPDRAEKYLVFTGDWNVDYMSVLALENLRVVLQKGISNDKAKYCLPESYKTTVQWTINMRSLQNFLSLRSDKAALWEIRKLAKTIFDILPEEHKYLFTDCMKEVENA